MVGLRRESGGDLVEHRLVEALLHTPGEQPEPEPIGVEVEQASHGCTKLTRSETSRCSQLSMCCSAS